MLKAQGVTEKQVQIKLNKSESPDLYLLVVLLKKARN